ncbi:MAG: hypothetical protein OXR73_13460, partial [Myxococcales bacterium]|nr:hypothetical protein [Myxococcales bacterium]
MARGTPPEPGPSNLLPFEARAYVDEKLVALSEATVRVDEPDEIPQLLFPKSDLRVNPDGLAQ